jgi:hypothetical protein
MTSNSSKTTIDSDPQNPAASSPSDDRTMSSAVEFITHNIGLSNITDIGNLRLPAGSEEAARCYEIKSILEEYADRPKVSCPISIAVFGPPGAGKSHCVREILGSLKGKVGTPLSVNLSQLSTPEDLADAFKKKLGKSTDQSTSVFFFDEFDAPLNGVSLGWLRWFLAPMQDSEFFLDGKSIKIGKAVFVFAGGTAVSLADFQERARIDPADYRDKKVPDFISRLRGFIDIQGINNLDDERTVRRALVLHHLLEKRWPGLRKKGIFPIDSKLVASLLSNVHFVHGARSMEALLDMCRFGNHKVLSKEQLPDNDLRKLHLSRGLLDGKTIGISAGQRDEEASDLLYKLTDTLLRSGATLAYGGDFIPEGTLHSLVRAARAVPDELVNRPDKRIRNYLGYPSFHRPSILEEEKDSKGQVEFLRLETLSDSERSDLNLPPSKWFPARPLNSSEQYNPKHHLAWALSLFRMRARLIQDINALIVVGGKDGESWGRFSGIAEEVVLAVALGKPVYVLGGRGGAAHAVGRLLGLSETLANPDSCLGDIGNVSLGSVDKNFANSFTMPGHQNLPRSISEVRSYLFERSVTTRAWPWNGLSRDENRNLFGMTIAKADFGGCVDVIIRGLCRLDWKLPSEPPK